MFSIRLTFLKKKKKKLLIQFPLGKLLFYISAELHVVAKYCCVSVYASSRDV